MNKNRKKKLVGKKYYTEQIMRMCSETTQNTISDLMFTTRPTQNLQHSVIYSSTHIGLVIVRYIVKQLYISFLISPNYVI